jgi:hypothetical protein
MTASNDPVGNRAHDLPDCNAVPQPIALSHTALPCIREVSGLEVGRGNGYPEFRRSVSLSLQADA